MDKIKIRRIKDDEYKVVEIESMEGYYERDFETTVFRGSLTECEAWIRLKKEGYLD